MHICIDFGNTMVKAAIYKDRMLVESLLSTYDQAIEGLNSVYTKHRPFAGNYSSVKSLKGEMTDWLSSRDIEQVTTSTPSPIAITYQSPETLGIDRFCNAVAGWSLCQPEPVLIIDAGTCITYDLVDATGTYLGGAISPGHNMRLEAMHHFTSRLPLVSKTADVATIGRTTKESLQLGAHQGIIAEAVGFTEYFKNLTPGLKVILTGGDQSIFEQALENAIFAAQNLVLEGLNELILHSR